MKLWDLRMVMASEKFNSLPSTRRGRQTSFDYRWGAYDDDDWYADPNDNSLVTFRGHRVLRTLIRCHFSPPGSTNSRYVYSGSEDGKVYIWNMDATLAGVVDAYSATKDSRPPTHAMGGMGWRDEDVSQSGWRTCVRDAAWHPNAPIIVGKFNLYFWGFQAFANVKKHLHGADTAWKVVPVRSTPGMTKQRKMKQILRWALVSIRNWCSCLPMTRLRDLKCRTGIEEVYSEGGLSMMSEGFTQGMAINRQV